MMGNSYIFIFLIFFVVMAIDVQLFSDTEGTGVKYLLGAIIIMVAMYLSFWIVRCIVNTRQFILQEVKKFKRSKLTVKEVLGRYYDYEGGNS